MNEPPGVPKWMWNLIAILIAILIVCFLAMCVTGCGTDNSLFAEEVNKPMLYLNKEGELKSVGVFRVKLSKNHDRSIYCVFEERIVDPGLDEERRVVSIRRSAVRVSVAERRSREVLVRRVEAFETHVLLVDITDYSDGMERTIHGEVIPKSSFPTDVLVDTEPIVFFRR